LFILNVEWDSANSSNDYNDINPTKLDANRASGEERSRAIAGSVVTQEGSNSNKKTLAYHKTQRATLRSDKTPHGPMS
jgi:hypothetical protein